MSLTTPPDAPSRSNAPATYISRMNAFLAWIVTFVAEMNVVIADIAAKYSAVLSNAATASTKAAEAAASATAAAVSAPMWASGNYNAGTVVWSPLNFKTYRARTTGSKPTDPSLDPTNWGVPFNDVDSAVNPKAITQSIYLTAAASGSTGITVPYSAAWALGTNNFALHAKFALPNWTPAAAAVIASIRVDGSNIIWWYVDTDGKLGIYAYIAGVYVIPPSKSTVATGLADGTMADIVIDVVRESVSVAGSITFRVNGVTLGASVAISAATPVSLTLSSPLYFGGTSTSRIAGTWQTCRLYNRALSDADALALYRNGLEFADKFGNQAELAVNGSFAADTNWIKQAGWTIAGGVAVATSAGTGAALRQTYPILAGVRYRVKFTISNYVSGALKVYLGSLATSVSANANGTYVQEIVAPGGSDLGLYAQYGPTTLNVDDFSCVAIGAVLDLQPEGIQPTGQWLDASGNALHAALPASGASLSRLMDRGMYRWTTPITGDTTLTAIVPAGFELDKIVFNNSTANAVSVRLGTTAGGVDVFGLAALNTSATLGGFKTIACNQAFSLTAAQTLYLSSTSWNSALLTATFYFRKIA